MISKIIALSMASRMTRARPNHVLLVLVFYQVMRDNLTALSLKSHVDREAAAKTILRVASKLQFFDPAKIHDQAIAELRDRSPACRAKLRA